MTHFYEPRLGHGLPHDPFNAIVFDPATHRPFNPMVNGYSGFKPASYYEHVQKLAPFPDQGSVDYLLALGVTHVLVDGRNMRPAQLEALATFPELHLWQTDGNLRIYLLTGK